MKKNGHGRPKTLVFDAQLQAEISAWPGQSRAAFLTWLRRWRGRPRRVWWVFDVDNFTWRME